MSHAPVPSEVDGITKFVVDAACTVHRNLGPGLIESVYEACTAHELRKRGVCYRTQVSLPIIYDGEKLDAGLRRLDLLVGECVIVELKAVKRTVPLFDAQLLTYLKLTGHRLGLLINFNVPVIKDGIRRIML